MDEAFVPRVLKVPRLLLLGGLLAALFLLGATNAFGFSDELSCWATSSQANSCSMDENGGGVHKYSEVQGWYEGTPLPIFVTAEYPGCWGTYNSDGYFQGAVYCQVYNGSGDSYFSVTGTSSDGSGVTACDNGNCGKNDGSDYSAGVENLHDSTHTLTIWGYAP